jgi:acyl-CoA thioester hydrolase
MALEDGWIDYNGHLNMAYYNVLFDRAADVAMERMGLGADAVAQRGFSFMTAEIHVCYVRELFRPDPVVVTFRILDKDEKRLHVYSELKHAVEGWLSATSEQMYLSLDMSARKVAPWPTDISARLDAAFAAQGDLPPPERAGRRIGIVRKV